MWGSFSEDSTQAQANTRPLRHKANRLVTGALRLSVAGVRRQEVARAGERGSRARSTTGGCRQLSRWSLLFLL